MHTVGCDALEWVLDQLEPVQVQIVKPWRVAALYELFRVYVSILFLHGREPRYAQVWQKLAVLAAMLGLCRFGSHSRCC